MDHGPFTDDPDLETVTTREQLAGFLRELHARADHPSLRSLERWAQKEGKPALSRSTVADMLSGRRFPKKAVLVTFVEACAVPAGQITPWRQAWERIAATEHRHPKTETAELDRLRQQVLEEAETKAAAMLDQARTQAEEIIAQAKRKRAQAEHLLQRWEAQASQTMTEPLAHADGHDRTAILVLNNRWCVYESLNADSSGVATLYKAYERADPGKTVVAKVFHQAQNDPQRFRTFLREVRGMQLSNPHIGEIIDSGQDKKSKAVYLISPLYQPGSLNLHVQDQPGAGAPLKWSLWVLDQVLAGLEAAAMSNIIHLDIKPQNIVLDGPSNVRIIDWGMSQLHEAGQSVSTIFPGGTKWFASPEQLGGNTISPNSLSDLYGVGALAYWLLTGMAPLRREVGVDADDDILQVRRLMEAGIRPERADRLVPGVPEPLGRLIDQWLSYEQADRVPEGLEPSAALGWARQALG